MEIRHSNFLSWLLDPEESHNLENEFLKGFVQEGINENKYTEITLNSLTQGILTDRIHEILLNSGIKNHLINFGEGKASGMTPLNNKWNLYINKKYIYYFYSNFNSLLGNFIWTKRSL